MTKRSGPSASDTSDSMGAMRATAIDGSSSATAVRISPARATASRVEWSVTKTDGHGAWSYGRYSASRLSSRMPKYRASAATPTISRQCGFAGIAEVDALAERALVGEEARAPCPR